MQLIIEYNSANVGHAAMVASYATEQLNARLIRSFAGIRVVELDRNAVDQTLMNAVATALFQGVQITSV